MAFFSGIAMIAYQLTPLPAGHRYGIRQTFVAQADGGCDLYLPVWIPGSYMRRDYARLLYGLRATVDGKPVPVALRSPSAWRIEAAKGAQVVLEYEVYARDVSVRGNYLDHERGFFNPCAGCIAVAGREGEAHVLEFSGWNASAARRTFYSSYDHLIDSPLLLGRVDRPWPPVVNNWETREFLTIGVKHKLYITGLDGVTEPDVDRLAADMARVCEAAFAFFGAFPKHLQQYRFLLHLCEDGYGGLEHRDSTLLMASRRDMPRPGVAEKSEGYIRLLGLIAHEYFHTWWVKDIKPRDYQPYRLQAEQPTDMLWLFEGFTSYFDDLLLLQAGLIDRHTYARLFSKVVSAHWQRRGRRYQTLAQSSLEAWTKLYNGGESAAEISTNYYTHGALFAFCLDAWLVAHGNTRLEDITAALWRQYREDGIGVDEASFTAFVLARLPETTHEAFRAFMHRGLHTTEELPLAESAAVFGWQINAVAEEGVSSECGFRWQGADFAVTRLDPDSHAARTGLAVDDRIFAVNGAKATPERLKTLLLQSRATDVVHLDIFRDGMRRYFQIRLADAPANTCRIHIP